MTSGRMISRGRTTIASSRYWRFFLPIIFTFNWIIKALNNFFLDSQIIQMEFEWLKLLFRSCARNFVRAYLMNGDGKNFKIIQLSWSCLLKSAKSLASAKSMVHCSSFWRHWPMQIQFMFRIRAIFMVLFALYTIVTKHSKGNEHRQQEQKQPGQNVPNANNNNGWRGISGWIDVKW